MADYRLIHGDALEVLRGMADNSVDAIVSKGKVDTVPFDVHVAEVAETNNVVEGVGLITVIKGTNGVDMVNVRGAMGRLGDFTTTSASIVVTLAGSASAGSPVGAVIAWIATAPSWVFFALAVCVAAVQRAKHYTVFALASITRIVKFFLAVGASNPMINAGLMGYFPIGTHGRFAFGGVGVRLSHDAFGCARTAPGVVAFAGTKDAMFDATEFGRLPFKFLAACGTCQRNLYAWLLFAPLILAFAPARNTAPVFEARRVDLILYPAVRA